MCNHRRALAALALALIAPSGLLADDATEQSPLQVRRVQQALDELGYPTARIDGRMGSETRQALREFQDEHGLPGTGRLDSRTLQGLGIGSSAPFGAGQAGTVGSDAVGGAD